MIRDFYILSVTSNQTTLIMDKNFKDDSIPLGMTWCITSNGTNCHHDGLDSYVTYLQGIWNNVTVGIPSGEDMAHVTGADVKLSWSSSKPDGYNNPSTNSTWYYLDGGRNPNNTSYSNIDGWEKRYAIGKGTSNYAWLFNYLNGCEEYGCDYGTTDLTYGYWTSSPVLSYPGHAWLVYYQGNTYGSTVCAGLKCGYRPTITVDNSKIK